MKPKKMFAKINTKQDGVILIGLLIFLIFVGMIITSLLILLAAESKMQIVEINQKRAQYAAESGIEYAMRAINEHAVKSTYLFPLNNYQEDIETGDGTHCKITLKIIYPDKIKIKAIGYSSNFAKIVEKTIEYIDVASYAVYATGNIKYLRIIPFNKYKENAKYFPLFDQDELIAMAKPNQYYPNDLYISHVFSFVKDLLYVGGNLTFGAFNWLNVGNFAVGGNIKIKSSWLILGVTSGVFYQFKPKSQFLCEWQFLWRTLYGGILTNGDVIGTTKPYWPFRFRVYYNRPKIANFLKYSVNGGPLIYKSGQIKIY